MDCLFCGKEIRQQVPILVNVLSMSAPWNEGGEVGRDILSKKYSCQNCYADILKNAANASKNMSAILLKTKGKGAVK